MYQYYADVYDVHDGDTFKATLDLGFTVSVNQTFRMLGINAPEVNKAISKEAGLNARDELRRLILGKRVILHSKKPDTSIAQEKYGRYLAKVIVKDESGNSIDVSDHMIKNGFAIAFMAE